MALQGAFKKIKYRTCIWESAEIQKSQKLNTQKNKVEKKKRKENKIKEKIF